jgi:protein-disulfide isomerase
MVVWRNYPFLGVESMSAAIAAECAARLGRFPQMHEQLFSMKNALRSSIWAQLALNAGIEDTAAFRACLSGDDALRSVRGDLAAGQRLGVRGTPSVLLDSLFFRGLPGLGYLKTYVERQTSER